MEKNRKEYQPKTAKKTVKRGMRKLQVNRIGTKKNGVRRNGKEKKQKLKEK